MYKGKAANEFTQSQRKYDGYRFPFTPYPKGWFAMAWADDLQPGQVIRERAFGRELVVFRTEAGAYKVLDALCPHLGAHLGVSGVVVGETIRCGFHGWRYDADGICVESPGCEKPMDCSVGSYPIQVVDGMVMAWYAEDASKPTWQIQQGHNDEWTTPILPEKCNWVFRSHVQEIVENGTDIMHLPYVHSFNKIPQRPKLNIDGASVRWEMESEVDASSLGAEGIFSQTIYPHVQGVGLQQVETLVNELGIWFKVYIYATPVDDELIKVRGVLSTKKRESKEEEAVMLEMWADAFSVDFEKDIVIWEAKDYYKKPNFSSADGPIHQFRKWATQFY